MYCNTCASAILFVVIFSCFISSYQLWIYLQKYLTNLDVFKMLNRTRSNILFVYFSRKNEWRYTTGWWYSWVCLLWQP